MPNDCPSVKAMSQLRRRAWREMQRLRRLLALVAGELSAAPKPPNFAAEGAILREAVADAFCGLLTQLDRLEEAVAKVRPYLSNSTGDGGFPNALIDLNRAANRPRVTIEAVRKLLASIEASAKQEGLEARTEKDAGSSRRCREWT